MPRQSFRGRSPPHVDWKQSTVLLQLVLGIFLWTLLEYSLHRWVFHLDAANQSGGVCTFHFLLHGLHHKVPFDPYRLVFPPFPATIIASIVYIPLQLLMNHPLLVCAGGLVGKWCRFSLNLYYFFIFASCSISHGFSFVFLLKNKVIWLMTWSIITFTTVAHPGDICTTWNDIITNIILCITTKDSASAVVFGMKHSAHESYCENWNTFWSGKNHTFKLRYPATWYRYLLVVPIAAFLFLYSKCRILPYTPTMCTYMRQSINFHFANRNVHKWKENCEI